MRNSSFKDCYLFEAVLTAADVSNSKFKDAKLLGAKLDGAILSSAEFVKASLAGADLKGAKAQFTVFEGADLSGADLRGADFSDARGLDKATLKGAKFSQSTRFPWGDASDSIAQATAVARGMIFEKEEDSSGPTKVAARGGKASAPVHPKANAVPEGAESAVYLRRQPAPSQTIDGGGAQSEQTGSRSARAGSQ